MSDLHEGLKSTGENDDWGLETGALELRLSKEQDSNHRVRAAASLEDFLCAQHYPMRSMCTNLTSLSKPTRQVLSLSLLSG